MSSVAKESNFTSDADGLPEPLRDTLRVAVPGYRLIGVLGRGGQGTVYRAVDRSSGETVAIKLLHGGLFADAAARRRFDRETEALRSLNSPYIVGYIANGQTPDGHSFLVMDFVDGVSLDEIWRTDGQTPAGCGDDRGRLWLFARVCRAVGAAHRLGITHRDLSPSNIRIDSEGQPHVLDFGLARLGPELSGGAGAAAESVTGQFAGKLPYASPEQAGGSPGLVGIRSDVYSLGVMLYQMVSGGRFPYPVGGGPARVLNNILHAPAIPPSNLREDEAAGAARVLSPPGFPPPDRVVDAIVLKALEKDPERRYESANEFARDVEDYLNRRAMSAALPTGGRQGQRPLARMLVACIASFAIGVAATAYWYDVRGGRGRAGGTKALGGPMTAELAPPAGARGPAVAPDAAPAGILRPATSPAGRVVDLLPLLDPRSDIVGEHRNWAFRDKLLVSHSGGNHLEFPYAAPEEYDLRVAFDAPKALGGQMMFFVPVGGQRVNWVIGERENRACGLDEVDGRPSSQNMTTKWADRWILPGERNLVTIQVRRARTACYLNDALVSDFETDYHNVGLVDWFGFEWTGSVGLMCNMTDVRIAAVELMEVSGNGRALRTGAGR